ncbi:Peptidoglycan-binding lysin domain protein [Desulfobulbus propionicus DSM 2032]|uniref:Peptidoglycan-binding lysin domain protein n=1 Tax=Desulfobulbus propionicus (strain ATCC 33891 / DSM 2032 / VKM B-1956 / 1pr3) TaxID=577650 RepID=A0A7U4DQA1_DESPD|nr:LysM domain-containing protein [Desulfobulbus propionicus]ADW18894.1 Peptidoglycan-binding lysin domain protein [Desulfobulbus propionicus DSM 2032]
MSTLSAAPLRELISTGRIVEARTLLTMEQTLLDQEEYRALEQELDRQWQAAKELVTQAETMEAQGRTEEAKSLYESVLSQLTDYPGIQEHIKRMDEALALTRAVQRRSQRRRESTDDARSARRRLLPALLGTGLAGAAAFLFLLFFRPAPQHSPPAHSLPVTQEPPVSTGTLEPAPIATVPVPPPAPEEVTVQPSAPPPPVVNEPATASDPATQPPPSPELTEQPPEPSEPIAQDRYIVQPGDSLSSIATRQFCDQGAWKTLYRLNKHLVSDPKKLRPGMELSLAGMKSRCPDVLKTAPSEPPR